jgi:hypothetical protein
MGFTEITAIAILGYLFYVLFIRGIAWPILSFVFVVYGGRLLIGHWMPKSNETIMTFMGHNVSYAAFVAALIYLLAIGFFAQDKN